MSDLSIKGPHPAEAPNGRTLKEMGAKISTLKEELEKARHERDLLRRPVRYLAEKLESHERNVFLSRNHHDPIPDDDEDCLRIEMQLGSLREARDALQAVEATPEKISRMREALERFHDYNEYDTQVEDLLMEEIHELKILTRELPYVAYRALHFSSLPEVNGLEVDEILGDARRYEKALREIAARGESFSERQPANEISHALMVELPDDAARALYPDDESGTATDPGFHHGRDIPF